MVVSHLKELQFQIVLSILETKLFLDAHHFLILKFLMVLKKFPDGVKKIKENAFCRCSSLKTIKIPNKVTKIKAYTFCDCSSLSNVTIPESVKEISYAACDGCSSLESINIPKSVQKIDPYAFPSNCKVNKIY